MTQREAVAPKGHAQKTADVRTFSWLIWALMIVCVPKPARAESVHAAAEWISTWTAASQPPMPDSLDHYRAQSLRLIVHISAGGPRMRIRVSNREGNVPITVGAAHIARRTSGADIASGSDRALTFAGRPSVVVPAHAVVQSDPVLLDLPPLSDVAVSFYLPGRVAATTVHVFAQQTSYVSRPGNVVAATHFPVSRRIGNWPFLTGIDVAAVPSAFTVVAFGDSMVDGDGSTANANGRWPDALAARLQHAGLNVAVINQGLIGNRLLHGSPSKSPFGAALGEAGVARFQRDVLEQPGVKVVIVRMGGNDLGFLNVLAPSNEIVDADDLIAGYKQLIAQARQHRVAIIGTTIPPFENAAIPGYYSAAKEAIRQQVNAWIRDSGAFDAVLDVDKIVRDPAHPRRLLPAYDSGDHLHPNDAGYRAMAEALPLETLNKLASNEALATRHAPATQALDE